ncbi:MAG: AAA-like domain-containing protein [Thainema sp.]
MTVEEALAIIDAALKPDCLSDLQEEVFRQAWQSKTYQDMALQIGYDNDYIRVVGFQLWQLLSAAFGIKVTKSNFRSVLRQQAAEIDERTIADSAVAEATRHTVRSHLLNPQSAVPLEFPQGPVPLNSPFYVERPPIEATCYQAIEQPGALICLRAPSRMGKTSLKNRVLAYCQQKGLQTVRLNFEQADALCLGHPKQLMRWCCANIAQQLGLPHRLEDYWDDMLGGSISSTIYMQGYVLAQTDAPIVLALDEVNRLLEYPESAKSFLPLLRSWYEEARNLEIWQKLRMFVVYSTEIYVPLDIHQSPFNVGLSVRLPEFTPEQVDHLAQQHGLSEWHPGLTQSLMAMIGGHPYLVRLALYHLSQSQPSPAAGLDPSSDAGSHPNTGSSNGLAPSGLAPSDLAQRLDELLQAAPTQQGIYYHHLRQHWLTLQHHPDLMQAVKQLVKTCDRSGIDPIAIYKLESMGLIKLDSEGVQASCTLYRLYFYAQLSSGM